MSQKDDGFTMRERKRLRQAPAPGLGRALMGRPGARRAWEDGKGVRNEVRVAGQAGKPRSNGAGAKPPGGEARAQGTHCVEQVQRTQAVLGTREAPANHLGACGARNRR